MGLLHGVTTGALFIPFPSPVCRLASPFRRAKLNHSGRVGEGHCLLPSPASRNGSHAIRDDLDAFSWLLEDGCWFAYWQRLARVADLIQRALDAVLQFVEFQ